LSDVVVQNPNATDQGNGVFKNSSSAPKVSVITICYNCRDEIIETLQSVVSQSFKDYEYIIIDGKSTDGTRETIEQFILSAGSNSVFISEKDRGIYDAMNKAIRLATGDFIIFMNAGDIFESHQVLDQIRNYFNGANDVIYGDHVVKYPTSGLRRLVSARPPEDLWRGMVASHQSTFVRTKIIKLKEFDLNERIGADFKLLFDLYCSGAKFARVDCTISQVSAGGISDKRRVEAIWRRFLIVYAARREPRVILFYIYLASREALVFFAKQLMPQSVTDWFIKLKRGSISMNDS
jgi:glycosyltransferase involved in cell wall biosynthesis